MSPQPSPAAPHDNFCEAQVSFVHPPTHEPFSQVVPAGHVGPHVRVPVAHPFG